jgi:AcrR family transcriptional regulator
MSETAQKTPRDRRRDSIIEVAREVFFEDGYAAASMSSIAARLGGSKGTLYNYFRSKEELFEAQVREGCDRLAETTFNPLSEHRPMVEQLTLLGERFLELLYSDWVVRTYRMVVAEAVRSPQVARIFYEAGPAVGLARLEAYLEDVAAQGLVKIEDCHLAAGEFLNMCRGHHHFEFVLNLVDAPTPEEIKLQARHAVSVFLKTYGA